MKTFHIYPALLFFFSLSPSSSVLTPLSAQTPLFYGMTTGGGSHNEGAIISFNPTNNAENVAWSFGSGMDGTAPNGSLVYDASNGLFYGMTGGGGSHSGGAIISFNPINSVENVVWSFGSGTDGKYPSADLVYDAGNDLIYGMTSSGGSDTGCIHGCGTIISFNPANNIENVIWNFGSDTDGANPSGNLVNDLSNGLFYGMTSRGGRYDSGAIVSFNPTGNAENVLRSFRSVTDGVYPLGSLLYDANNDLFYGMTSIGGRNSDGVIISFNAANNAENVVWNFESGTDGGGPCGDLVYDGSNSLFYGMTSGGGSNDAGTIINFNPTNDTENVVWNFGSGADGSYPHGDLVYDERNGLFYGMTLWGGNNGPGTIISFNATNNTENVVWSFGSDTDGANPNGNLVLYTGPTGINTITNTPVLINIYPNPANTMFTITGLSKGQTVALYNYLGQKISTFIADHAIQQLDISTQASGIYFVQVLNEDGAVTGEKKVVKIGE